MKTIIGLFIFAILVIAGCTQKDIIPPEIKNKITELKTKGSNNINLQFCNQYIYILKDNDFIDGRNFYVYEDINGNIIDVTSSSADYCDRKDFGCRSISDITRLGQCENLKISS